MMRALTYTHYGPPERLRLAQVALPAPGPREVRVAVEAVSLNASDAELLQGRPAYTRIWGLRRPTYTVLGSDVAGRVDAVGAEVTALRPGDRVFGDLLERWGGLSDFVLAREEQLAPIPEGLSCVEAAAIPQAGVLALQCLRAHVELRGQRVLLNGAGGGAGTFALQLARHLGAAHVTAVDHARKLESLTTLGADRVIDYATQDYCAGDERYDRIIDFVGTRSLSDNARVLSPTGSYLLVGGPVRRLLATLALGALRSAFARRRFAVAAYHRNHEDLELLARLCIEQRIRPIIGHTCRLSEAPAAFRALIEGRVLGKVVVTP